MIVEDFTIEDADILSNETFCVLSLHPWINVGNVAKIVVERLSKKFHSKKIGELHKPSEFYDYTRYRPKIVSNSFGRSLEIPNTKISLIRINNAQVNIVFIQMLEPHMFSEKYNDSVISLLDFLKIKLYILIGSMYDSVPHSRSLLVTGSTNGLKPSDLPGINLSKSNYSGPTSITSQITDRVYKELGISTISLIVHLPMYIKLDNDFSGAAKLLSVLLKIFKLDFDYPEQELGIEQYSQITPALIGNDSLKDLVAKFEADYDKQKVSDFEEYSLSPEVESFLKEISEERKEEKE
ncbi:MAG: hypothetical protein CL780_04700 [Chloroflexi bacterium]|nr:hypothetical protein [Chloroflexota bacterium]|tara:strand:- start:1382 stop:2266 length:885 start_codon:yes stop_codon:yes gene_type:complete